MFVTDCKYVELGFRKRKFKQPVGANADLWLQVRETMAQRPGSIQVKWAKAHVTAHDIATLSIPHAWIIGNSVADALAKRGAALNAVPEQQCNQLALMDERANRVRWRLALICDAVAQLHPRHVSKARIRNSEPRERRMSASARLAQARADSLHKVVRVCGRWVCSECRFRAPKDRLIRFLRSPCHALRREHLHQGQARPSVNVQALTLGSQQAHPSHSIAHFGGLWWCWKCGCLATTYMRDLAAPCKGSPSEHGRQNLRRLRMRKHPRGVLAP